jgi:hypothetical protein
MRPLIPEISVRGSMPPVSASWPDYEIVQALTYTDGNEPTANLPTSPCGGGPVKEIEIRGAPTHVSATGGPVAGPISTFKLCQKHRKEASIRAAKLAP